MKRKTLGLKWKSGSDQSCRQFLIAFGSGEPQGRLLLLKKETEKSVKEITQIK